MGIINEPRFDAAGIFPGLDFELQLSTLSLTETIASMEKLIEKGNQGHGVLSDIYYHNLASAQGSGLWDFQSAHETMRRGLKQFPESQKLLIQLCASLSLYLVEVRRSSAELEEIGALIGRIRPEQLDKMERFLVTNRLLCNLRRLRLIDVEFCKSPSFQNILSLAEELEPAINGCQPARSTGSWTIGWDGRIAKGKNPSRRKK